MFTPLNYLERLVNSHQKSPDNWLPGPLQANPGLLPPGGQIYEDGSYRMAPPPPPFAPEEFLPGLFGGPEPDNNRPSTFVPYPVQTYG